MWILGLFRIFPTSKMTLQSLPERRAIGFYCADRLAVAVIRLGNTEVLYNELSRSSALHEIFLHKSQARSPDVVISVWYLMRMFSKPCTTRSCQIRSNSITASIMLHLFPGLPIPVFDSHICPSRQNFLLPNGLDIHSRDENPHGDQQDCHSRRNPLDSITFHHLSNLNSGKC